MVLQFWHNALLTGKKMKLFHSNVQPILTPYADFFQMIFDPHLFILFLKMY